MCARLKSSGAGLSVIYLLEISQSWMTFTLVPHRRLARIIIDHPLEGDNHICLGWMAIPQAPWYLGTFQSPESLLEAHQPKWLTLHFWNLPDGGERGNYEFSHIYGLDCISFSDFTKKNVCVCVCILYKNVYIMYI